MRQFRSQQGIGIHLTCRRPIRQTPCGCLRVRLDESRSAAEGMAFRIAQWELSPNGFVCSTAFRDGRSMAQNCLSVRGTSRAKIFWQGRPKRSPLTCLPTRLTQARRSRAKAGNSVVNAAVIPRQHHVVRFVVQRSQAVHRMRKVRSFGESGQSSLAGKAGAHRHSQRECRSSQVSHSGETSSGIAQVEPG